MRMPDSATNVLQALNHTANENRRKNDIAHKSWVEKHSPLEIKQANLARNQLRRHAKKVGSKRTYPHIKDDRLVKAPANQYSLFLKDRYDSGDMKGMTIAEVGKLVGREWKSLSASEKKVSLQHAGDLKIRLTESPEIRRSTQSSAQSIRCRVQDCLWR